MKCETCRKVVVQPETTKPVTKCRACGEAVEKEEFGQFELRFCDECARINKAIQLDESDPELFREDYVLSVTYEKQIHSATGYEWQSETEVYPLLQSIPASAIGADGVVDRSLPRILRLYDRRNSWCIKSSIDEARVFRKFRPFE